MKSEALHRRFWETGAFQIGMLGIALSGSVALASDFFKIRTLERYFLVMVAVVVVPYVVSLALKRTELCGHTVS